MGIDIANDLAPLRARIAEWKRAGLRVGLVPTMGNLHAGHHSLVRLAREHADRVVASVFVNPTQFGPDEDFSRYPRTPEADAEGLAAAGCDLLWMPTVETMYPFGADGAVRIRVPGITDVLEGAHRPGHFDGVLTVVMKLLQIAQPERAYFGEKDWQQLSLVRGLVDAFFLPVTIVACPTVRETDGLALSSRNSSLRPADRQRAPLLYRALSSAETAEQAARELSASGFVVDYVEDRDGRRLGAVRIGGVRLIDNLPLGQSQ